jgi:indole-3-glycerol phosphate synthase
MTILARIVDYKKKEVQSCKELIPVTVLEQMELFGRETYSLRNSLSNPGSTGIIAEFKRKSPSKGMINGAAKVETVTTGYARAGAAALSVLTDYTFFGGTNDDLIRARTVNRIPILRKDFTIDEYQIIETKAIGADAILLIAAIITPEECRRFAKKAHEFGLEVLLEVHNNDELECSNEFIDIIGVNNRNLKTFEVDLDHSAELAALIPSDFLKISESGIGSADDIIYLKQFGFSGFLIGENFMKHADPVLAFRQFIEPLINRIPG